MELKNVYGEVIFALDEAKTVLELVTAAVAAKKSLRSANLRSADLRGADLRGANLSRTDLRDVNLSRADLSDADLRRAILRDANLSDAILRGADMRGAILSRANMCGAILRGAILRDGGLDGVPVIPDIHKVVYAAASKPNALDMGSWHSCDTTHCRAGWVVTLAGAEGMALEWAMGTPTAATVIYMASDPKLDKVPDFYASNEEAMEDMQRLAGV